MIRNAEGKKSIQTNQDLTEMWKSAGKDIKTVHYNCTPYFQECKYGRYKNGPNQMLQVKTTMLEIKTKLNGINNTVQKKFKWT